MRERVTMNNYQIILQIPYVKFAVYEGGYQLLKNKFKCSCKRCGDNLSKDTFVLWKPNFGCICAADCVELKKTPQPKQFYNDLT